MKIQKRYLLLHLSHNKEISEDLTSEVFIQAIKSLPTFNGDSTIKTWLIGIARYKWLELIKKENNMKKLNQKIELYIQEIDYFSNSISNKEIINRIYELLDEVSVISKQIVLMRVEGYSFDEIASALSISSSSARVIDFRTKKKIKEILNKEGYHE